MIDTHAHIDADAFDADRDEVIKNAIASGVEKIIIPAINPAAWDKLASVVNSNEIIYQGIGIHPHNANDFNEETKAEIIRRSFGNKVVAIGEIGLDYYYDFAPKDVQINAFREQLKIAKSRNLPVIVHNRESDDDILRLIEEEQDGTLSGVLHCFSSDVLVMNRAIELGFHISFTGNVTFKKSTLDEVIEKVPNDKFMIETDSPYITPVPHRGKRNEPQFVKFVAQKIAEIKNISFEEIITMSNSNAIRLFKLSVFALMFILASNFAISQKVLQEEDEEIEEIHENPNPKTLGVGFVMGINTIVETQQLKDNKEADVSYEGVFSYGGSILYSPLNYMWLQATYLYSKNTKVVQQALDAGFHDRGPDIYNLFELTSHWVPNPNKAVNFYGIAGMLFEVNKFELKTSEPKEVKEGSKFGLIGGLGFNVNVNTGDAGLFCLMAEWRLNFPFGTYQTNRIERISGVVTPIAVDASSFYSIPRAYIMWYPPFLN